MQTAVHAACMNGSVTSLCSLLEYGGDLNVRTLNYETPRDIAVRKRHMEVVSVIEEACKFSAESLTHLKFCDLQFH